MQSIFSENRFGGQTKVDNIHWIYAVLPMSADPLRPRPAIFSCASIFPKSSLKPEKCGYMTHSQMFQKVEYG